MSHYISSTSTLFCFHCGEACDEVFVVSEDKKFCCQGCKLVYEVLSENGLCNYYDITNHPGESRKSKKNQSNRFDYLEDKETAMRLLDFQNEIESRLTFYIPNIHCASCIWLLENLNQIHAGIAFSRVDFIKKKVQIKILLV